MKSKNIAIIVGVSVGSGLLLLLTLLCCLRKRINKQSKQHSHLPLQNSASVSGAATENKLVFLANAARGNYTFDVYDLLRASAEVLGKGSVGMSYKVVIEDGTMVVVKRLKDVVVTKPEFESTMDVLGKIKNEHVVLLRAYNYSEAEKFLVYDYLPAGSLSARLHGSKDSGQPVLDWGHRIRIALSAAKGVAYLHDVEKLVHGNIKSSNVLLQEDEKNAIVSDFGLNILFAPNHQLVPGYVAPEVLLEDQKLTFESDVYSFGIFLLELLTGKVPNQAFLSEDLPRLVQHNTNVREECDADVFYVDLTRHQNIELEMVRLLKIAVECVSTMPNQRPSMDELVTKIEDIKQVELDDTSVNPSKGSNSHTPSIET